VTQDGRTNHRGELVTPIAGWPGQWLMEERKRGIRRDVAGPTASAGQPAVSSSHATFTYPDRNGLTAPDSGS